MNRILVNHGFVPEIIGATVFAIMEKITVEPGGGS